MKKLSRLKGIEYLGKKEQQSVHGGLPPGGIYIGPCASDGTCGTNQCPVWTSNGCSCYVDGTHNWCWN